MYNYFEWFGLPESFAVDQNLLRERYEMLQKQCHPDELPQISTKLKQVGAAQSARIHQAYRTLNTPVERAQYLLRLKGIDFDSDYPTNTDWLVEQLRFREMWEEIIEDGTSEEAVCEYQDALLQQKLLTQKDFIDQYVAGHYEKARDTLQKWRFFEKLEMEIQEEEEGQDCADFGTL